MPRTLIRIRSAARWVVETGGENHARAMANDARPYRHPSPATPALRRRGGARPSALYARQPARGHARCPAAPHQPRRSPSGIVTAMQDLGHPATFRPHGRAPDGALGPAAIEAPSGSRIMTHPSQHVQGRARARLRRCGAECLEPGAECRQTRSAAPQPEDEPPWPGRSRASSRRRSPSRSTPTPAPRSARQRKAGSGSGLPTIVDAPRRPRPAAGRRVFGA